MRIGTMKRDRERPGEQGGEGGRGVRGRRGSDSRGSERVRFEGGGLQLVWFITNMFLWMTTWERQTMTTMRLGTDDVK